MTSFNDFTNEHTKLVLYSQCEPPVISIGSQRGTISNYTDRLRFAKFLWDKTVLLFCSRALLQEKLKFTNSC